MEVTKTCTTCGATESSWWYRGPTCNKCRKKYYNSLPSTKAAEKRRHETPERKAYEKAREASPERQFLQLERSAIRREIDVSLTLSDFKITRNPCFYCGGPLPKAGHGLDRIDNSKGYSLDNVLPCCTDCNFLRADRLSVDETKALIELLKQLRKTGTNSPW